MGLQVRRLFFEHSLKRWHFEDLVRTSGISRERTHFFLKKLLKEGIVKRIKPRGKMPYYISNRNSYKFREQKRFYGLRYLHDLGLFEHISSLKKIKTAILFGSFARGDWNHSSDIDLFVYGEDTDFDRAKFEKLAKREIQLFSYKSSKDVSQDLDVHLVPNIVKGFNIKGSMEPFEVTLNG
jgi:predicted nucleotidyltransferase